jgi:restriction endonuclease Mrr
VGIISSTRIRAPRDIVSFTTRHSKKRINVSAPFQPTSRTVSESKSTLMLHVLKATATSEVRLADLVTHLSDELQLTDDEKRSTLPSGRQTTLANRAGWAKTYLTKGGVIKTTGRGYFEARLEGVRFCRGTLNLRESTSHFCRNTPNSRNLDARVVTSNLVQNR